MGFVSGNQTGTKTGTNNTYNRLDKRLVDIILAERDLEHQHASVEEFRNDLDAFVAKPRGVYYPAFGIDGLCLKRRFDYYTAEHHILFHSKHGVVHFYIKLTKDLFACIDESRDGRMYHFTLYSHHFSGANGSLKTVTELHHMVSADYNDKPAVYGVILSQEIPKMCLELETNWLFSIM